MSAPNYSLTGNEFYPEVSLEFSKVSCSIIKGFNYQFLVYVIHLNRSLGPTFSQKTNIITNC